MHSHKYAIRIVQAAVFMVIMYAASQLALNLGVEEKSWWQRSWEIFTGGGLGLLAGLSFFLLFGAVGWVSGVAYGALGLLGLATGGALGGLGLGALLNVARNPEKYNISISVVFITLAIGCILATWSAKWVGRQLIKRFPRADAFTQTDEQDA